MFFRSYQILILLQCLKLSAFAAQTLAAAKLLSMRSLVLHRTFIRLSLIPSEHLFRFDTSHQDLRNTAQKRKRRNSQTAEVLRHSFGHLHTKRSLLELYRAYIPYIHGKLNIYG